MHHHGVGTVPEPKSLGRRPPRACRHQSRVSSQGHGDAFGRDRLRVDHDEREDSLAHDASPTATIRSSVTSVTSARSGAPRGLAPSASSSSSSRPSATRRSSSASRRRRLTGSGSGGCVARIPGWSVGDDATSGSNSSSASFSPGRIARDGDRHVPIGHPARQPDHLPREVDDAHLLAHLERVDLAAPGHRRRLQDELHRFLDAHEVAGHRGIGDRDGSSRLDLPKERRDHAAPAAQARCRTARRRGGGLRPTGFGRSPRRSAWTRP